jgi:hypothetical protein
MRNVNLDETASYFERHPDEWQTYCDQVTPLADFRANWRERGVFHLPHGGGRRMRLIQEAIADGTYVRECGVARDFDVMGMYAYRGSGAVLINSCNLRIDHLDPRAHARGEMAARRAIPIVARFLQDHVPGFEEALVSETAAAVGVRYTRWIDAGFDLRAADLAAGAQFDDVIGALSAHTRHPQGGVIHLAQAAELPYRIMIPRGVDNLVVASGKSVSTQPRGLVRGQVPCYVLGQAAGVAAAVTAASKTRVDAVDVRAIQRALLAQRAYLGDAGRIAALGLDRSAGASPHGDGEERT